MGKRVKQQSSAPQALSSAASLPPPLTASASICRGGCDRRRYRLSLDSAAALDVCQWRNLSPGRQLHLESASQGAGPLSLGNSQISIRQGQFCFSSVLWGLLCQVYFCFQVSCLRSALAEVKLATSAPSSTLLARSPLHVARSWLCRSDLLFAKLSEEISLSLLLLSSPSLRVVVGSGKDVTVCS